MGKTAIIEAELTTAAFAERGPVAAPLIIILESSLETSSQQLPHLWISGLQPVPLPCEELTGLETSNLKLKHF